MSEHGNDALDVFTSEQVITCADQATGLRAVIAIDNTTLGPGFGGTRWRPYPSQEAAISEAQRLAAAMTLKHACAELPYGGAKSVIICDDPASMEGEARTELMAAFGRFIARTSGSYIPGVDMGTHIEDMQVIREQGARAFCADVDPGAFTAQGVYAAMRAAVQHELGRSMDGVRVVVQGVGAVGAALARSAAKDGAQVTVADVDAARAQALADEIGGATTNPQSAPYADCDVFAPCAIARVLTSEGVGEVKAKVVCGAANDTLDHPGVAGQLQAAGVTFVPDFVANAGGVIQVHADEVGWSHEQRHEALEAIGPRVTALLEDADARGVSAVQAALDMTSKRIAAGREAKA